jgi:hypothetical protein
MSLREGNQRVSDGEVVGVGIGVELGMEEAEVHLDLRRQPAEFRTQNGGMVRLAQITAGGGRADCDVARPPVWRSVVESEEATPETKTQATAARNKSKQTVRIARPE